MASSRLVALLIAAQVVALFITMSNSNVLSPVLSPSWTTAAVSTNGSSSSDALCYQQTLQTRSSLSRQMEVVYVVDVRTTPSWQRNTLRKRFNGVPYVFVANYDDNDDANEDVIMVSQSEDQLSTWSKVHQHLQPTTDYTEWVVHIAADTSVDLEALPVHLASYKDNHTPLILSPAAVAHPSNFSETMLEPSPIRRMEEISSWTPLILSRKASRELARNTADQPDFVMKESSIFAQGPHHCCYQNNEPYLIRPCHSHIVPQPEPSFAHHTTVVTALFPLKAKHSLGRYHRWMRTMLSIQDPVIVFVPQDEVEKVRQFRLNANTKTLIVPMNLSQVPLANLYPTSFWEHQLEMDGEGSRHQDYRLFWIWLSKSWFIQESIRLNPFKSDMFMWCDIGSLRYDTDVRYEHQWLVRYPELVPRHSMLQMAIKPIAVHTDLFYKKKKKHFFFHSGSHAIGYHDTWSRYHKEFMVSVNAWVKRGYFIGEDQMVMQHTCVRTSPLCLYASNLEVQDDNYFGLKYILHFGGDHQYQLPPVLAFNASNPDADYNIEIKLPENDIRRIATKEDSKG